MTSHRLAAFAAVLDGLRRCNLLLILLLRFSFYRAILFGFLFTILLPLCITQFLDQDITGKDSSFDPYPLLSDGLRGRTNCDKGRRQEGLECLIRDRCLDCWLVEHLGNDIFCIERFHADMKKRGLDQVGSHMLLQHIRGKFHQFNNTPLIFD